jgi:hypothetical protein
MELTLTINGLRFLDFHVETKKRVSQEVKLTVKPEYSFRTSPKLGADKVLAACKCVVADQENEIFSISFEAEALCVFSQPLDMSDVEALKTFLHKKCTPVLAKAISAKFETITSAMGFGTIKLA